MQHIFQHWFDYLVWLLVAVSALAHLHGNLYSSKPLRLWSWTRRLLFAFWSGLFLACTAAAAIPLLGGGLYDKWVFTWLGMMFILMIAVPCGIEVFNTSRLLKVVRNIFLFSCGALLMLGAQMHG